MATITFDVREDAWKHARTWLETFLALRYNVSFQSGNIFKTRPHRFLFLQDKKTEERTSIQDWLPCKIRYHIGIRIEFHCLERIWEAVKKNFNADNKMVLWYNDICFLFQFLICNFFQILILLVIYVYGMKFWFFWNRQWQLDFQVVPNSFSRTHK